MENRPALQPNRQPNADTNATPCDRPQQELKAERDQDNHKLQVALITGGASGLGFAFSKILACRGWKVLVAGRNEDKLNSAKQRLIETAKHEMVETIAIDLSVPDGAEQLFTECKHRDVELLINNAGAGVFGLSIEQDVKQVQKMVHLNINALTTLCILFGKQMAENKRGYILNIGSLAGRQPMPFFAAYGATKSYVTQFSLALRAELADKGVSVTCMDPGYVSTDFDCNAGIKSEKYLNFSQKNSLPPEKVALTGLEALFARKGRVVPGVMNKAAAVLSQHMPQAVMGSVLKKAISGLLDE